MPGGRPTKLNDKVTDQILRRLECGESLRSIARDPKLPDRSTILLWRRTSEEFSSQYERAWCSGMEARADELIEIGENATPENVQVARLQADNLKWLTARIGKNRFGDKQTVTHEASPGFSFQMVAPKEDG